MTSTGNHHLNRLAETLSSHLSRPLQMDTDAKRFVAATYGDVNAETLRAIFADIASSDAETLLELLLFPDIAFQLRIEPLLSATALVPDIEHYLCAYLRQASIMVSLGFDDADEALRFPLPDEFLDRFVVRLRTARRWPAALDEVLSEHLADADRMRLRVMLRNGPAVSGDAFPHICGRFLAALSVNHRDFWPAISLLVHLAAELDTANNPFALLSARKQRAFQMLEQQREFEHRLRRSNIETLLGQGQRVPTFAKADARKQMRLIDVICQAVYGKTTYFQPVEFDP